jgi:radical SAM superfamily enzyme YgiQ (UPF0313 family)
MTVREIVRVLLINSNTKRDFLAAPPLGLCYVAEAAESAGHEVRVLDLWLSARRMHSDLEQTIKTFAPEVIGISIRNIDNVNLLHRVWYLPVIDDICKDIRRLTSAPMVVGGSGVGILPEDILRYLDADYVVVSDGEDAFVQLLYALEHKKSLDAIPGVGMLQEGEFHLAPPAHARFTTRNPDLGKWIDIRAYQKFDASYNIQAKRGCAQHCIYCTYNQALEGNALRLRDPKDVVDEIEEALFKYNPHTFEFVDSVLNEPLGHSIAILEEIIRRPWKAHFTAMGVSPRRLDKHYLDLMWQAGFRSFMITPESASETMLHNYRKGFSKADVIKAAEAINQTAFAVWWFIMIGGPGETNKTLQESLNFGLEYLQKRGRPVTHIVDYFLGVRVYPGTQLWHIAIQDGLFPQDTNPLQPLWYVSEGLDLDEAAEQMDQAARKAPEIYFGFDERVLMFSKAAGILFSFLKFPRPYWRYFRGANLLGLRTGIRFMFKPPDIAGLVRNALKLQGYDGPLLREKPKPAKTRLQDHSV